MTGNEKKERIYNQQKEVYRKIKKKVRCKYTFNIEERLKKLCGLQMVGKIIRY